MESILDVLLMERPGTLFEQILHPSAHELWMRTLVILLFVGFSLYFHKMLLRVKKAKVQLQTEISQRQQAEEAYRRLNLQNELILEAAGEGIFGLDLKGEVTFVNPAALRICGYKAEELLGRHIHQIFHHTRLNGTPHPKEDCPISASLINGESKRVAEDIFWTREGKSFPVEYIATPIKEQDGLRGVVVVFRDISGQRQAEAVLTRERDFAATLLDAVDAVVLVLDGEGGIIHCNPIWEQIAGCKLAEIRGKPFWEIFAIPEEAATARQIVQMILAGKGPACCELHWGSCRGERRLVAWSVKGLDDDPGRSARIIVTGVDITGRKHTEKELQDAKEFLENVIENSADPISVVNARGRFTKWNKAAQDVIGYSFSELGGKAAFDFYADKEAMKVMLGRLRRDGFVRRYEINLKRKDGVIIPVALSISLLYGAQHRALGSICVARDLSDIRAALSALQQVNAQLRDEIRERQQVEGALHQANAKLKDLIQEFEQRNEQIMLLNELGDLLQACFDSKEAYACIAQIAQRLFSQESGALLVLDSRRNLLESVAVWGGASRGEQVFAPEDCWALRRGVVHLVPEPGSGLVCKHLAGRESWPHMCIPMIAQGGVQGLLVVQSDQQASSTPPPAGPPGLTASKQRLAEALAKQVSLALANLHLREILFNQAVRDPLTGLFNRRYLEETLERELQRARRRDLSLGLMIIDLDNFKGFNDTFGHQAGDALLSALADLLQTHVRREDIACRFGGEEFVIILPEASLEVSRQRAELLRQNINDLEVVYLHRPLGGVTASFGVAAFPDNGQSGEEVFWAADAALFLAKERGRNRVMAAPGSDGPGPENSDLKTLKARVRPRLIAGEGKPHGA